MKLISKNMLAFVLVGVLAIPAAAAPTESTYWLCLKELPLYNAAALTIINAPGQPPPADSRNDILILTESEKNALLNDTPTLLEQEITEGANRTAKAIGLITAPASTIVAILDNFDNYLKMFKDDLREADHLIDTPEGSHIVAFRVFDKWPKKKYYTNFITRTGNLIQWRLADYPDIEPFKSHKRYNDMTAAVKRSLDDFQINTGSWQFFENANGTTKTLAVYTITLRLAGAVMGSKAATKILNSLSRDNMPNVIKSLALEAETRAAEVPR